MSRPQPNIRQARTVSLALAMALIVIAFAPADALARRPRSKGSSKGPATVELMSLTRDANVYIDDDMVGTVPLDGPVAVKPGIAHTIRVQKRGFTTFVDTFKVAAGDSVEIEADLVPSGGVLRIKSNIMRAQVIIDDKAVGLTPFDGDVPPGKHVIQVVSAGYLVDKQILEIKAGEALELDVQLDKVPPPTVRKDNSLLSKWWFWGGIGAAVVGGVTIGVLSMQVTEVPATWDHSVNLP